MPARKFSPKEKLAILDEVKKNGQKVSDVCKKYGISRFTFYNWAKNWRDPSNLRRVNLLREKRPNGKNHPKAIAGKREKLILECVLRNPGWSSHRIERFLGEYLNGAFKVSNHGIQNVLKRYSLNTEEARFEYSRKHLTRSVFPNKFTDFEKYKIIEEYLIAGRKIAQICRQFHISRFTFYAWLKKYEVERTVSSLSDARLRGESHPKFTGEAVKQKVLDFVAANPAYSVHRLHAHLAGEVGHHAIQNILSREDLNTFAKRQLFAQGYAGQPQVAVAPLYEAPVPKLSVWRMLFAPFRTIPKWVIKHPVLWPIVFPTLAFLAWIFEVDKLARPQMFFPIVALTFGFVFFLYSLKYYISLIIVMRLAQSGGGGTIDPSASLRASPSTLRQAQGSGQATDTGIWAKVRKVLKIPPKQAITKVNPLLMNLDKVELEGAPFVSIHVAVYNEKRVIERLIEACKNQKWANYEVILADDSTDETTEIIKNALSTDGRRLEKVRNTPGVNELHTGSEVGQELEVFVSKPPKSEEGPIFKLIHRFSREGFKGAALQKALENTNPYADYVVVFDSDFVPYADTLEQFMKAFQALGGNQGQSREIKDDQGLENPNKPSSTLINPDNPGSRIAAVQGYQWHVLNKSENWVTRGVRSEYAGSYVIERAGIGIYGGLNMIAGSVFCLRADVLRKFGWGKSITEDLELTLRLYEAGYKVVFTPYIQAPAEAVSTIKRLIRQRMRWAEGHTFNIRKMWTRIFASPHVSGREKFEFLYLSPYYLQAAFFIFGSFAWFIAEVVLHVHLPFWTAAWGWSLVFVNFLSLPLMNLIGLFLEESDERDYLGIASFVVLAYILVPFQAYAAVKALFENEEGPWFRTPKTGNITDVFGRVRFYQWFEKLKIWSRPSVASQAIGNRHWGLGMNMATNAYSLLLNASSQEPSAFNSLSGYSFRPRRIRLVSRSVLAMLLVSIMILNYFAFFVPQAEARHGGTHLEQQANIIDQEYSTTSTSYTPTNGSLGLIKWEATKFAPNDSASLDVDFEAVLKGASGTDVGKYTAISCFNATNCMVVYYDVSNADLKFLYCLDGADAGTNPCDASAERTITTLDSAGDVGQYPSIFCISASECKIAYYHTTNTSVKFISCVDAGDAGTNPCDTAAEVTTNVLDGETGCTLTLGSGCTDSAVGKYTAIDCPAATNCKVVAQGEAGYQFMDCDDTNCGSGNNFNTPYIFDSQSALSIDCPTSTNCKVTGYYTSCGVGNGCKIFFSACSTETCSGPAPTNTQVDTNMGPASINETRYTSVACVGTTGTNCKIAYTDIPNGDLKFLACGDANCATSGNTITTIDSTGDVGTYVRMACPAATDTDCKISYYDATNTSLKFLDCGDANCATSGNTITTVDGSTDSVGQYSSIACPAATDTDCKISYYDATNTSLKFADCDNTACSSSTVVPGAAAGGSGNPTVGFFNQTSGAQADCGSPVEVTTSSSTYTRVRFSACTISLTDTNEYTIRLKSSNAAATISVRSARLIITQNPGTGVGNNITKTQGLVEVGNNQTTLLTSYAELTRSKIYCPGSGVSCSTTSPFNPNPQSPNGGTYFEATMVNNTTGATTFAQLYNNTDGVAVTGSAVTVVGTTWTRARSGALTYCTASCAAGDFKTGKNYVVQAKVSSGTGTIATAKIVFDQVDATNGVTDVETTQMYNNTLDQETATGYQTHLWNNEFTRGNVEQTGQSVSYFFETNMALTVCGKGASCTAYAQLYNSTGTSAISGSEQTTTSATFARKRSADLNANMPAIGTSKDLTIQMKIAGSGATVATNDSWLIIQIAGLQIPETAILALPLAFFFPKVAKKIRVWWKKRRKKLKSGQGKPRDG